MVDKPYFMENPDWYKYDFEKKKYILTKNAPVKAKESYDMWIKQIEEENR